MPSVLESRLCCLGLSITLPCRWWDDEHLIAEDCLITIAHSKVRHISTAAFLE